MTAQERLSALKRRAPDGADALLNDLLDEANEIALDYTGLSELPDALDRAVIHLAALLYNRAGAEGETERTESGLHIKASGLPDEIKAQLNRYRRARTVEVT